MFRFCVIVILLLATSSGKAEIDPDDIYAGYEEDKKLKELAYEGKYLEALPYALELTRFYENEWRKEKLSASIANNAAHPDTDDPSVTNENFVYYLNWVIDIYDGLDDYANALAYSERKIEVQPAASEYVRAAKLCKKLGEFENQNYY